MKTIGLIGGTGWASSAEYYRLINEYTNHKLGGLNYAHCILYSLNYADIYQYNLLKDYAGVYSLVNDAAQKLVSTGAQLIALCANTLHFFAEKLQDQLTVPLIHIGDAVAQSIQETDISKVGLLGTLQTMQQDFYKFKLKNHNIETITPSLSDMEFINHTIFYELFNKKFSPSSKKRFIQIMNSLHDHGAQGIILGCTEIPLLINQNDFDIPLFDTLQIHAESIVQNSLK